MKNMKKLFAVLIVIMMLLSLGAGAMSTYASDTSMTDEEYQAILAAMGMTESDMAAMMNGETGTGGTTGAETTSADISPSDLSASDLAIADMTLQKITSKRFNFSILIPSELDTILTTESTDAEYSVLGLDSAGFADNGLAFYTASSDGTVSIIGFADENASAEDIYSYNSLSSAELEVIMEGKKASMTSYGYEYDTLMGVKIGGQTFIRTGFNYSSEEGDNRIVELFTVKGGVEYSVQMQLPANMTEADNAKIEEIIKSVRVGGKTVRMTTAEIVLTVVCSVMFLLLAAVVFFLVRFSLYSKASGSRFNIIGFDIPKLKK
jgi:hypothetical protein